MEQPSDPAQILADIGLRIADLRQSQHRTQEMLAEAVGTSTKYVQKLEAGIQNTTVDMLVRIANALEVTPSQLWVTPVQRERLPGRPRKQS